METDASDEPIDRALPPHREPNFDALRRAVTEARKIQGWTLKDLADEAHISGVALLYLERGDRDGTLASWFRVAEALGIELPVLMEHLYDDPDSSDEPKDADEPRP